MFDGRHYMCMEASETCINVTVHQGQQYKQHTFAALDGSECLDECPDLFQTMSSNSSQKYQKCVSKCDDGYAVNNSECV